MELTQRQALILKAVVREHGATRRPVGSRTLVEQGTIAASASTVRYELGRLEELGLLEHPHTSAGRVPTDLGYRLYVDELMQDEIDGPMRLPVSIDEASMRIDEALRETTEALTEATSLLALVTAPPASGAVIRHVEVLLLQPHVIVVVCITATGDVTRHVVTLDSPVDPGLVDWAGAYLNEEVAGMALGQRMLRQRLANPELSGLERWILALLAPAFTELVDRAQQIHIGGTSTLVGELGDDLGQVVSLIEVLDERRRLLDSLSRVLRSRRVQVSIGAENDLPELRPLSVVGTSYGVGGRALGLVGLIGPRSMNYPRAVMAVHAAASRLSLVAQETYGR